MTNEEILIRFTNGIFCKEMHFSKNTIVKDALSQFLKETETAFSINDLNKYLFYHGENVLNFGESLNKRFSDLTFISYYKNKIRINYSTIYDGGGDLIEFCDVSNGKKELINSNIIYGTPDKGINIYG